MPIPSEHNSVVATLPGFPRDMWSIQGFARIYFNHEASQMRLILPWAAMDASREWARKAAAQELGTIDELTFTLAVLDKTVQVNAYNRCNRKNDCNATKEEWKRETDVVIGKTIFQAFDILGADHSLNNLITLTRSFDTVRLALNSFFLSTTDAPDSDTSKIIDGRLPPEALGRYHPNIRYPNIKMENSWITSVLDAQKVNLPNFVTCAQSKASHVVAPPIPLLTPEATPPSSSSSNGSSDDE